jgi:hypothetical protein
MPAGGSYLRVAGALVAQGIAALFLFGGVWTSADAIIKGRSVWGAFFLTALGLAFAGLTWHMCYTADLDGLRVYFRQLTGTRQAMLSDITKISAWSGEGGKTYVIRFTHGRAVLEGKGAREFIDALLRANPTIAPPNGWVRDESRDVPTSSDAAAVGLKRPYHKAPTWWAEAPQGRRWVVILLVVIAVGLVLAIATTPSGNSNGGVITPLVEAM